MASAFRRSTGGESGGGVRASIASTIRGSNRSEGSGNSTSASPKSKVSKGSKNSVAHLAGRGLDSERARQGLETAEEALKADYPLIDTAKERVPKCKVLMWSLPFFGWYACKYMKNSYMRLFYVNDYPQASLGLIALFSVLAVIIDAFSDPLMANVTDNARPKRWGRRAPFVLFGGLLTWFTFSGSYYPLVPAKVPASLWYGFFHIMFKLSDTVLLIAQEAWGAEMSPSSHERSNFWTWRELMLILGVIVGIIVPARLAKLDLGGFDCFTSPDDKCLALPVAGFGFGFLCFIAVVYWVCRAKERDTARLPAATTNERWSDENIVPMLVSAWCNRPFKYIIASEVSEAFGMNMPFVILGFYLQIVLGGKCMDPVDMLSLVGPINLIARLLSVPFWWKLADCFGPANALIVHNFALAATHLPFVFIGRDDESCGQLTMLLVLAAVWGAAFGGNYLIRSVTSNIADYDTFVTGRYRSAQYMMVAGFLPKFWEAMAESMPILMLAYYGYVRPTTDDPDPEQPWKVVALARVSVSLVPCAFVLMGAILMCGYPKAARSKAAHKALLTAIYQKHQLGKEAEDPWYPGRIVQPPPEPNQYAGVLSFFFPFELRRAVGIKKKGDGLGQVVDYKQFALVPKITMAIGAVLSAVGVFYIVWDWNDLFDGLGFSWSVPGAIGLGFAILLFWFGTIRWTASKEVERLGVPLADIVEHHNFMCRFTCQDPVTPPTPVQSDTIGSADVREGVKDGEGVKEGDAEEEQHPEATTKVPC